MTQPSLIPNFFFFFFFVFSATPVAYFYLPCSGAMCPSAGILVTKNRYISWLMYFFFFFLGPHPWHMLSSQARVELELRLPAYTTATATAAWDPSCICDLHHSSQQRWLPNPQGEARDRTHILVVTSRICICCATMGIPLLLLSSSYFKTLLVYLPFCSFFLRQKNQNSALLVIFLVSI